MNNNGDTWGDNGHAKHNGTTIDATTRFLTVGEIALTMRVSKMTVYRLLHSGDLEAIRVGRSFRVPEQAVNQYMRDAFVTQDL